MKISVSMHDISQASLRGSALCPVGIAASRALGRFSFADNYFLWLSLANHEVYRLPAEATEFLLNFDRGMKVEPFEFELELTPA